MNTFLFAKYRDGRVRPALGYVATIKKIAGKIGIGEKTLVIIKAGPLNTQFIEIRRRGREEIRKEVTHNGSSG